MLTATPAQMRAACQRLSSMGAPHLPLFTAVQQAQVSLIMFTDPASVWRAGFIKRLPRPAVIVVSDDPDVGVGVAVGPSGWDLAPKLRGWANAAMIHGAGGEPEHYRQAVKLAKAHGRLVIVDTSSRQALAWGAFLNCPRSVLIMPNDGPHPIVPPGRVMQ